MTLREARLKRQLSLVEACRLIGEIDPGGLSRIERGEQMPGRDMAERLFKFYGGEVEYTDIFGVSDELPKSSAKRRSPPSRSAAA